MLIPEDYVADLPVRLALYRRLAEIEDDRDIEAFGAELVDRFGPMPEEVGHLLQVVGIKALCRRANVERIEVGPKGAVLAFRDNIFSNPEGLDRLYRQAPGRRARAAGHEGRVLRRMGHAARAAQGRGRGFCGVWFRSPSGPRRREVKLHQRPFLKSIAGLSHGRAFSVGLIDRHKKVPHLSVGMSMTIIVTQANHNRRFG